MASKRAEIKKTRINDNTIITKLQEKTYSSQKQQISSMKLMMRNATDWKNIEKGVNKTRTSTATREKDVPRTKLSTINHIFL